MKMMIRGGQACIALVFVAAATVAAAVDPGYQRAQQRADAYYAEGDYRKAYRQYRELAKIGDSFSQYRVSTMNLYGKGRSKDVEEAFAWAVLASQNQHPELVRYRDLLWQALTEEQREDAGEQAEKLINRYGNLALAEKARQKARRRLSSCTGSRLSTRCEDVQIGTMPLVFGAAGGNGFDGEVADAAPGRGSFTTELPFHPTNDSVFGRGATWRSAEVGDFGSLDNDIDYYRRLRDAVRQLDEYIAEHPAGRVELREFEVLEDTPSEESTEGS